MTSTSVVQKTSNLPGNGSTFSFDFSPLIIYQSSDIEVTLTVTSTGAETLLTEGTGSSNYSVNVTTYPGTGTITYPADSGTAMASTSTVTIKKVLALTQPIDVNGALDTTLERQLDKIVGMLIQQQEEIDRCLKIPISDSTITSTEINSDGLRTAAHHVQVSSDGTTFTTAATSSGTAATASSSTPAAVSVSAGASGSGSDFSRDDHVHLLPTTVPRLATENIYTETQIWAKGGDVTAAGALDLDAKVGNIWDITGSTAITSIGSIGIGCIAILQFDSTPVLTHHSTNLVLPGGVDILMQAGDIVGLYEYASADWRLLFHTHGTATNGRMPGPDYESAETSLNNDAQITFAHGLAVAPSKVEVVLRANTTTAESWANNEEMIFPNCWQGAASDDLVDVTSDATNVYITQGNAMQLIDHSDFNTNNPITQSEYDWVVRAWK